MNEGKEIFENGESDKWIVYEVVTDSKGIRHVRFGSYYYDTGDDGEDKHWRCVSEDVCFTLEEWVRMIAGNIDPQETDRYCNRRCDYIEDLTEHRAREDFESVFNLTPKLDMEYINYYTPDGNYIGRYEGMRKRR